MSKFKMSLAGTDIKTANIDEIVVDNLYPNPKIDTKASPPHSGVIKVNWNDTTGIASGVTKIIHSFPHNYNSVPTVFANYDFEGGQGKGTLPFQYGAQGLITIDADEENINLKYYSFDIFSLPITAFKMEVKFYVMAEQGIDT